jgi:hypothetical protein
MSSSVVPIEVSPLRDVRTDDHVLTVVLADGRVIATPLEWYPRLAHGTPAERANWRPIGDGEGIHWPDLDEDISVEGLIAGRKSGESARSFKRWLEVQEQLRRMPPGFRERRREVLRVGPLSAAEITKRVRGTVAAWETPPADWHVGVSADPFEHLRALGVSEDDESIVVFDASDEPNAREAERACLEVGLTAAPAEPSGGAVPTQVFIYMANSKRNH